MSTKYRTSEEVPTAVLCERLHQLAEAISNGKEYTGREFTMRVPAEVDRDADLVMTEAAQRLEALSDSSRLK